MANTNDNISKLHQALKNEGYNDIGSEDEFRTFVSSSDNVKKLHQSLKAAGYDDIGSEDEFDRWLKAADVPEGNAAVAQQQTGRDTVVGGTSADEETRGKSQTSNIDADDSGKGILDGPFPDAVQAPQIQPLQAPQIQLQGWQPMDQAQDQGSYTFTESEMKAQDERPKSGVPGLDAGQAAESVGQQNQTAPSYGSEAWKKARVGDDSGSAVVVGNGRDGIATNVTLGEKNPYAGMTREEALNAVAKKFRDEWYGKPGAYSKIQEELANYGITNVGEYGKAVADIRNSYVAPVAKRRINEALKDFDKSDVQSLEDIQAVLDSREMQQAIKQDVENLGMENADAYYQALEQQLLNAAVEKFGYLPADNARSHARQFANTLMQGDARDHEDRILRREYEQQVGDHYADAIARALTKGDEKADAIMKAHNESVSPYSDTGTDFGALRAARKANEERDPDKILDSLLKSAQEPGLLLTEDPKMLEKVWDDANAKGMNIDDYINTYVAPAIQSGIIKKFEEEAVKRELPQGTFDYVMRGLTDDSVLGMIYNSITRTPAQIRYRDIANAQAGEDKGILTQGARLATGMASDFWLWGGWGKIGSAATGRLLSQRAAALAAREHITKEAAVRLLEEEGRQYLGKGIVDGMLRHIPQSAITMGGAEATSEAVRGITRDEEAAEIIKNTLGAAASGAVTGTAFGVTGGVMGRLTSQLSGVKRLAGKLAGLEVEAGTLYTTEELQKLASGEYAFQNPYEGLLEANVKLGFIKASANPLATGVKLMNAIAHPVKAVKGMMKPEMGVLDEDDVRDIRESFDGKALLDALTTMRPARSTDKGEREGYITEAQAAAGAEAYRNFMSNTERPMTRKLKVAKLLGGMLPPPGYEVRAEVVDGRDGIATDGTILRTRDIDGQVIREQRYDSREEAEKAAADMQRELEDNATKALEERIDQTEVFDRFRRHFEDEYQKIAEKYASTDESVPGEEMSEREREYVYLHQHQNELLDAYQQISDGRDVGVDGEQLTQRFIELFEQFAKSGAVSEGFKRDFEYEHGYEEGAVDRAIENKERSAADEDLIVEYRKAMLERLGRARELESRRVAEEADAEEMRETADTGAGAEAGRSETRGDEAPVPPADAGEPETPLTEGGGSDNAATDGTGGEAAGTVEAPVRSERRQAAYDRGTGVVDDLGRLPGINYEAQLTMGRLTQLMPDKDPVLGRLRRDVVKAVEAGDEAEVDRLISTNSGVLTDRMRDAIEQWRDVNESIKGIDDAIDAQVRQYATNRRAELQRQSSSDGSVTEIELTDGSRAHLLAGDVSNRYGGVMVVMANGETKQIPVSQVRSVGERLNMEDLLRQDVNAYEQQLEAQYSSMANGETFMPGSRVDLMVAGKPFVATVSGIDAAGNTVFTLEDGSQVPMSSADARRAVMDANKSKVSAQLQEEDMTATMSQQRERFAKGIVGYSEGKPDYSAEGSDAKVVAEYLAGNSSDSRNSSNSVLKGIDGEVERLVQTIADGRETVRQAENKAAFVNGLDAVEQASAIQDRKAAEVRVADAEQRIRKWGEIRQELMSDDERTRFERERIKKISKAAAASRQQPSDEEAASAAQQSVTGQELIERFDEQRDAEAFVEEEQKRLRAQYRDELFPQLDDVRKRLADYRRGLAEYSDDELQALTGQLSMLEAEESRLKNASQELGKLSSSLGRLYAAKEKAQMSPREQKLAALSKETNRDKKLKLARQAYADDEEAASALDDMEPRDVYEWVASSLGQGAINWEGLQRGEHYVRGLRDELGKDKQRGLGRGSDTFGFNYFLAPEGKGKGIDEVVHDIAEGSPYDTQEVRNALLDMLASASKPTDISHRFVDDRIAQAEETYNANLERELEAENDAIREMTGMEPDEYDSYISSIEEDLAAQEGYRTSKEYFNQIAEDNDRENERRAGGGEEASTLAVQREESEPVAVTSAGEGRAEEAVVTEQEESREDVATQSQQTEPKNHVTASPEGEGRFASRLDVAKNEVNTHPTDAQKEAGNYKKGHLSFGGYEYTIENPKGSVRSGIDANGRPWEQEMKDTYGYIRGKYGTDGDHIDMFINDNADLDSWNGRVFIVDQKKEDGSYDEHKVMYGYKNWIEAKRAYERNYEKGWWNRHVMQMMGVKKEDFDKWLADSDHKRKPFADYFRTKMLDDVIKDPVDQMLSDVAERRDVIATDKAKEDTRKRIEQQEIGGAMVDRLEAMGMDVSIDPGENRRARKIAEKDQSEAGKMRHFETPDGKVYGFVYKGKLYLDPTKIDAELPIHEYAHPWCEAIRRINPENWKRIVDLMRGDKDTWDFVKQLNPDLKNDDDIAEEMIAKYSGRRGAERAKAEFERMNGRDSDYKSRWNNIWKNISKAIQDFWKQVGDFLNLKYESAEQVFDQVVKDFANKINPVKRVEEWLQQRDDAYLKAVKEGDDVKVRELFDDALRENIGNGITPFVAVSGYRGKAQKLAHGVKSRDPEVIAEVADLMAPLIPKDAVLVPAPSHSGKATDMLDVAQAISELTGAPIADVLRGGERDSQYKAKKAGRPLSVDDLGIKATGKLPDGKLPVVIDNVVDTGSTAEACVRALGKGIVVSLADSADRYKHVASLKSAEPVVTDKAGKVVPLSKRFELGGRYLEKADAVNDMAMESDANDMAMDASIVSMPRINQFGFNESDPIGRTLTGIKQANGENTLAGYFDADGKTYLFMGKDAGAVRRDAYTKGTLEMVNGVERLSVPETELDVVLPILVRKGYKVGIADTVSETLQGKPAGTIKIHASRVKSIVQGELFSDKDFEDAGKTKARTVPTQPKGVSSMSDEELLKAIGENEERARGFHIDEYDKRHRQEYNEVMDAYSQMLEENNTSLDDAYSMYADTKKQWADNGGYATPERTQLLAQIDALEDYIEQKEAERMEREEEEEAATLLQQSEQEAEQQYQQQKEEVRAQGYDLTQLKLRPLKPGETSHVERRYVETGMFSFTGGEYIESIDDVAFIFKELEDAAVENTFMVLEKDGVPTIIHLAIGNYNAAHAPFELALAAAQAITPDKVYFVHNHPSGNLKSSRQDRELMKRFHRVFGDKLQDGIIIDTKSGKYGVFYEVSDLAEREVPTKEDAATVPMKVYSFSKQVFASDWNPEEAFTATSAKAVAEFVSSHRLGEHKKMSLIVMDQAGHVTGNVFLPWTAIKDAATPEGADLIASYVNQMGGNRVVIYGNYEFKAGQGEKNAIERLNNMLKNRNVSTQDIIHIDRSAYDMGDIVMESSPMTEARDAVDMMLDEVERRKGLTDKGEADVILKQFFSTKPKDEESQARQRATQAVLKAMDKAGVPYEVVSKDQERKMLTVFAQMNQDAVKEFCRRPDIRAMAPHGSGRYAVYNVEDPFGVPMYAEKQSVARWIKQGVQKYGGKWEILDIGWGDEEVTRPVVLKTAAEVDGEVVQFMLTGDNASETTTAPVFVSNALKAVEGMKEASSQVKGQQEIGRTLMGVHNISEEKLRKAIKQGGLANPSLAVIDIGQGFHNGYGEISLIPKSDMIDARTGGNAGTYLGDAYTPTYPTVETSLSDKGREHISEIAKAAAGDNDQLMRHLRGNLKDFVEGNGSRLHYLFLQQTGRDPKPVNRRLNYSEDAYNELKDLVDGDILDRRELTQEESDRILQVMLQERYGDKLTPEYREKVEKIIRQNDTGEDDKLFFSKWYTFMEALAHDARERKNPQVDWRASDIEAENRVYDEKLSAEYEAWKKNLLNDEDIKEELFAGFDRNGYRKLVPNTVANASRLMNKESDTNAYDSHGIGATRSTLLEKVNTLSQIRKNKGRLGNDEKTDQAIKEASDTLFEILQDISGMEKISDNPFMNIDYAEARLQEAFGKKDPLKHLRDEYGYDIADDSDLGQRIKDFVQTVKKLPVRYFETKFKRPVGLDEFSIAVVPESTSPEVVEALKDAGLDVRTYDASDEKTQNENRRQVVMDAVQGRDDIMFQKEGKKILGWIDGKGVHLTEAGLNPNTPIHECTHMWDRWCMKEQPELWKTLVAAMKKTAMWEQIRKDANYRNIWEDEDRMASEVHSRLSGAVSEEEFMKAAFKKGTPQKIINEVKSVLRKFWEALLRLFGKQTKTNGNDWNSVDAMARMPLRDLLNQDFEKVMRVVENYADGMVEGSIVTDKAEIERLNNEPTEKGYRNVVMNEDGTLGSPMGSKLGKKGVGRKATSLFEFGKWERSDENPDLATDDGKIDLIKPDGKSVGGVDYNPYIHIRPDKVNKQFKQAWERPNLIYVETEYPSSELKGEYKAEKAKKAVGRHDWNGGELILSRWDKPVRMVPWEEVADDWMKAFEGRGVEFDIVPPKLLPILAERGMEILPPHKGMGKACNDAYEEWVATQIPEQDSPTRSLSQQTGRDGSLYRHTTPEVDRLNNKFNEELERQINDPDFPANHIYNLGKPSTILLSTGFPNDDIELSASHLKDKSEAAHHPFRLADVKDLVKAINSPIAVFSYGDKGKSQNVIAELQKEGKNFVVGIHFNQSRHGMVVSDIRGLYPKDNAEWLNWITQGKLLYADQEKIQNLIAQQRRTLAEVSYLDLNSVAKLLKDFENPKLSAEKLQELFPEYARTAEDTGEMLGGVKVILESESSEDGTLGWYNPNDNSVHVVLPEHTDADEVKRTVMHEKLGHEGLVALFTPAGEAAGTVTGQEAVNAFGMFVFRSANKELRERILNKADEEGYKWSDPLRLSKAAQEVFADIAADGPRTADEFSLWRKVKHYLIKMLNRLGLKIRGLLNDHDLRYYVLKTGEALKRWDKMSDTARQSLASQSTSFDIMRNRIGKPRKRDNESVAQYMQRLREWEKWQIAMEQAAANNDPMPDKAAIDKRWEDKYNADMDEWRQSHHIQDDTTGPGEFPKRRDGESPQEYAIRVAKFEEQSDVWKNSPDYFEYLSKGQDEYRRAYEEWKRRYDLQEAESVDLNMYEGRGGNGPETETDFEAEQRAEQDMGDAFGVQVDSEGAKRHAKLAVIERRKNLESSNAEDALWLHDLMKRTDEMAAMMTQQSGQKVTGKMLREALPFIIEGTYWEEVLKDDRGNIVAINDISDQLPIKKSDELDDLLDHIKEWYDHFFFALEDAGLRGDAGYIGEGYVNHIWDKGKSDPKAWERYVENYQRTKSPNMKHREVDTYQQGIDVGLVPKFKDIADIMAYYSRSNNEALANKKFLDDLSFMVVEETNSDGEVVSVLPLMNSKKPDPFVVDRYAMYHVPGVGDVYVLKDIQKRFSNIFGTMRTQDVNKWLEGLGKAWDITGSTAKKIELALSGFHALALWEVDVAQNGPLAGLQDLFKYIVVDSAMKGTLPAYAHPEDFKFAASHLVQLGATEDYAAADVNNITGKLRELVCDLYRNDNGFKKAAGVAGTVPATMLDWVNKGFDTVLWNYLHDGLKIAAMNRFKKQIDRRASKEGLSDEERDKLYDEAGQYVNDMFGGQYWELLNVSPATMKWMRRLLLSPDWLVSTNRHFFANFGFGSLYSDGGWREYLKYNWDNIKRAMGAKIDHNELRRFRSKNSKQCYIIGVLFFWNVLYNALNALNRRRDEVRAMEEAKEIRKTDPEYRSPYELAYPDGMKWYDYTMLGNSVGQQTHLFTGRYEDGAETYVRWGKQFREFPEMFIGRHGLEFPAPLIERMKAKGNPNLGGLFDFLGAVGVRGFEEDYQSRELREKYGREISTLSSVFRHFIPFGIPTQADKEYKTLDFFMPSSKGFSRYKAVDYFKTFIMDGDMRGVEQTYKAAVMNGVDAEECLKAAIGDLKATRRREMADGVTDLTGASERFEQSDNYRDRSYWKNKMDKFLGQEDYQAMSRDAFMESVRQQLNDETGNWSVATESYLMHANRNDIIEDWRVRRASKLVTDMKHELETMKSNNVDQTYIDEYNSSPAVKRLKEVDKLLGHYKRSKKKADPGYDAIRSKMGGENDNELMKEIRDKRGEMLEKIDSLGGGSR